MNIIGLMSGTSVDGIDAVVAEIDGSPAAPRVRQRAFVTVPWDAADRTQIFRLFDGAISSAELCRANAQVGERFAAAALTAVAEAGLDMGEIDMIGSHGQTVWHDVNAADGRVTSTLQIGDPSMIAGATGVTTVANFRTADVAAGGQGAPLTSVFDWLLLRPPADLNGVPGGWRAVQNIGGMGNVTLLPPLDIDIEPLAFDTGPGNALIDWAAVAATRGELLCDVDGTLAASGRVDGNLLEEWLSHGYFEQSPPKTTGRELFGAALAQTWRDSASARGLTDADFIATLTELTAASIAHAYASFAPGPVAQVVVGGGGARNPTLMRRLRHWLGPDTELVTHAALGYDDDAKEALVFALLAYLSLHGAPGNVPACTGAQAPVILGQIAPGPNWGDLLRTMLSSQKPPRID